MIKRILLTIISLSALLGFSACEKGETSQKFISGLPLTTNETVLPAQAMQQWHLLIREGLAVSVAVINRLGLSGSTYPELSGPDGSLNYTFTRTNTDFGTANFILQFQDVGGTAIDPINIGGSTQTFRNVLLSISGNSNEFSYSGTFTIYVVTPGMPQSDKSLNGSATISGSGISVSIGMVSPGGDVNAQGIIRGPASMSGTGLNSVPTSSSFFYSTDHSANGTLSWQGKTGGINILENGNILITTPENRILID